MSVHAQFTLSGQLSDATSGEAIGFATVYLDGTSIGDVSRDDGTFRLTVPADRDNARLIISHLNYQTQAITLSPEQPQLRLALQPKATTLTRIEVEDEDLRAENLREFHDRIIGRDAWGQNATILNDEVIRFDRDVRRAEVKIFSDAVARQLKKRNHRNASWSADSTRYSYDRPTNLKAFTRSAVRIQLADLGYELHLDLQYFLSDYDMRMTSHLGTNYYIPDTAASPKKRRRYAKNRQKAYYGSSMHFIRSLLKDSLSANGFQVVEVITEEDGHTLEVPILLPINLKDYLQKGAKSAYYLTGLGDRDIAILYYKKKRAPERITNPANKPNILQSRMKLIGQQALIYPNGALGDTNLVFSGDIGSRGLAWSLPLDYSPE